MYGKLTADIAKMNMDSDGTQSIDNTYEDAATMRLDDTKHKSRNVVLNNRKLKVGNGASFDPIS